MKFKRWYVLKSVSYPKPNGDGRTVHNFIVEGPFWTEPWMRAVRLNVRDRYHKGHPTGINYRSVRLDRRGRITG